MSARTEDGEDGERQAESGIPPSHHYERHVRRGRETQALTWARPHRERQSKGKGLKTMQGFPRTTGENDCGGCSKT